MLYTLGNTAYSFVNSESGSLLLKAIAHGTLRTDEKGRTWFFNSSTSRWRIQKTKEDKKRSPRSPKLDNLEAQHGDIRSVAGIPHLFTGEWTPLADGDRVAIGDAEHIFQGGMFAPQKEHDKRQASIDKQQAKMDRKRAKGEGKAKGRSPHAEGSMDLAAIPDSVLSQVKIQISAIKAWNEKIESARETDRMFQGGGRYAWEASNGRQADFSHHLSILDKFKDICKTKGLDGEGILSKLGFESPIKLAANEASSDKDEDPRSLEDLFVDADRIGSKYQSPEEKEAFEQAHAKAVGEVSDTIDRQFPQEDTVSDYGGTQPRPAPISPQYKDPTSRNAMAERMERLKKRKVEPEAVKEDAIAPPPLVDSTSNDPEPDLPDDKIDLKTLPVNLIDTEPAYTHEKPPDPRSQALEVLAKKYPDHRFRRSDDGSTVEVFKDGKLIAYSGTAPHTLMNLDERIAESMKPSSLPPLPARRYVGKQLKPRPSIASLSKGLVYLISGVPYSLQMSNGTLLLGRNSLSHAC